MLGFNDIAKLEVHFPCREGFPCTHRHSSVTLNDGRTSSSLNGYEIWTIISNIAQDKINPGGECEGIIQHFQKKEEQYNERFSKTPSEILNKITFLPKPKQSKEPY